MKKATFILAIACVLSSCTHGPASREAKKDNTVFSWLSTTTVTQPVAR